MTDRAGGRLRATAALALIPLAVAGKPGGTGSRARPRALRFKDLAKALARPLLPDVGRSAGHQVASPPRDVALRQSFAAAYPADFHPIAEAIRRLS